jgi:hypothetical protein
VARINLGDLVRMPLPDEPSPDYFAPAPPAMLPSLPSDLAENFFSSMEQGDVLTNQGMPYAAADESEFPPISNIVTGGPPFVATQPGGGLPIVLSRPGNSGGSNSPGGSNGGVRQGLSRGGVPIFTRTPILPDSILPPALSRQGILQGQRQIYHFNRYDRAILAESRLWEWIAAHGGIKSCCRIPEMGAPLWSQPPWQVMPSSGIRFQEIFFQPLPAISGGPPFNGVDTVLGNFRCEIGFDGVVTHFICGFNGNGFDDGSGDIAWRLKIGQRYAKTLGNVTFTFGDIQTALTVPGSGYRLVSGQTIQLIANIPNGSPVNGGRVFAGVLGWTYPRR